ncbi:MAG: adenylate/guanylate cyclase domain-containing protein, partial [Anaerolineales bacterium]
MESLNVYIPADRRMALSRGQSLPDQTDGAVLFADISGFTPLTELLSQKLGPQRGAEEVTHQLNNIYGALIAQVHNFMGSVINFSGDAITCWFDGDDGRRATTCALAMQKTMLKFQAMQTVAGIVSFSIKAGVTAGPVRRFLVGKPSIRTIETLAGSLLDRVAAAEKLAQKGEIVIGSEIIKNLGEADSVTEWREGKDGERYAVISTIKEPAPETPWGELPVIPAEQARDWLFPVIYERLQSGAGEFLAELRPVVALFLKFSGITYEEDDALIRLDNYIRWVQEVLARFEGNLLELIIGDKGSH